MAKISAKGAVINVDDSGGVARAISADVVSYTIDYTAETIDITGFTEPQNFTPGVVINKITMDVLWNSAATTGAFTVLRAIVGSATSKTVSIVPEVGGLTFSGEFLCAGIHVAGAAQGQAISLGTVEFYPMGAVAGAFA